MSLVEKKYKLAWFVTNQELIQDNEKSRIVINKNPMRINCSIDKFAGL